MYVQFYLQTFAKEGAKVIATDIQLDKLKELETMGNILQP